jgi:hypothetical protein
MNKSTKKAKPVVVKGADESKNAKLPNKFMATDLEFQPYIPPAGTRTAPKKKRPSKKTS